MNRRNYDAYKDDIETIDGLSIIEFDESERCNWQYIVVEVGEEHSLSRNQLMEKLHSANVRARRYFWPGCHRMEPYARLQPESSRALSVTKEVGERVLVLPTGTNVGVADIEWICRLMSEDASVGSK